MYLSPADEERLRVFAAAELARRTVARGLRLNAPEAVALACDEMHLAARAGGSFDDVLAAGQARRRIRRAAARRRGPGGRDPAGGAAGRGQPAGGAAPALARRSRTRRERSGTPGEQVVLHEGRERQRLTVRNGSARPVRVSSHYPFWRVNPRLEFDRESARGLRLDIPAGSSVRWDPGEVKEIGLVRYGDDDEHSA